MKLFEVEASTITGVASSQAFPLPEIARIAIPSERTAHYGGHREIL